MALCCWYVVWGCVIVSDPARCFFVEKEREQKRGAHLIFWKFLELVEIVLYASVELFLAVAAAAEARDAPHVLEVSGVV